MENYKGASWQHNFCLAKDVSLLLALAALSCAHYLLNIFNLNVVK